MDPSKNIIPIESIANYEKIINGDGAGIDKTTLIIPGTLTNRCRGILKSESLKIVRSQFHTLIIISEGNGEVFIEDQAEQITSDHLVIVPENILFTIKALPYCEGFCLHFHAEFLKPVLAGLLNEQFPYFNRDSKHTFRLTVRESRLIQNCFKDIIRAYDQKSVERESLMRDFTHILLLHIRGIYRTFSKSVQASTNRTAIIATRFIHFVEQNFKEMRTVQQYADLLNISPKYLTKIIKKEIGKTPQAYIHDLLLIEAKTLLKMTDRSVSEIAYSLSFTDQPHFSNFIKKHTGATPLDLRGKA